MKKVLWLLALAIVTVPIRQAAQAREWVVSPDGSDKATGTAAEPFQTISRGAAKAQPGDTILVRAGLYRERVTPPRGGMEGQPITYRGERLGLVFIKGSEEWKPDWQRYKGSVYFGVPDKALFDDDVYIDSGNPFFVELASTPYSRDGKPEVDRYQRGDSKLVFTCGQVIVNGKPYVQRPFLREIENRPGTWTFAPETERIYINFGELAPAMQKVEITVRRRNFAAHVKGLGHIVVEGFVMAHWRAGRAGAVRMGLEHGLYCVGCCWILMALLFVAGVMNLLWVAVISLFVLAEKVLPRGELVGRLGGAILLAAGVGVLTSAV